MGYQVAAENEADSDFSSDITIDFSTNASKGCRVQSGHVTNLDGTYTQLSVDEFIRFVL